MIDVGIQVVVVFAAFVVGVIRVLLNMLLILGKVSILKRSHRGGLNLIDK